MDWKTCVLLVFSSLLDGTTSSQIDCFLDEQECQIEADNQIDFFTEIPTSEECAQLCNDDRTCTAFTHFGAASYPLHEACFLFSSCRERRPCTDCITGSNQAECKCSVGYEGYLDGSNLVDFVGSVPDEFACKKLCALDDQCSVYTYYGPQDKVNPNVCFLLNSAGLQNPVKVCDNCTSGPAQCNTNQECQVAVFALEHDNNIDFITDLVIFISEQEHFHFEMSFEAKEKGCYINTTFLAIGGGGESYSGNSGGGSGYIAMGSQLLFSNSSVYVSVGAQNERSLVQVDGETLIAAASGGTGFSSGGGNGYSGGGGGSNYNGAAGGSNGGDGGNSTTVSGGKGSGLDLSTLHMNNFVLTPGKGGEPNERYGGGGGGVIVNGIKPGNATHSGEGFGGGAYGYGSSNGWPGCVLIET